MKVNYLPNTCNLPDWREGEQTVAFIGDKILFGHDFSDDSEFNITDSREAQRQIQRTLKTEEEIEFVKVDMVAPSNEFKKAILKYFGL